MHRTVLLVTLLAPAAAQAFCGTYVGEAGADLYADKSEVIMARTGTRTTLTMRNAFEGNSLNFAMVIPVPSLISQADIATVDAGVFAHFDAYSAPREVTWQCPSLVDTDETDAADSDFWDTAFFDTDAALDTATGVSVFDAFVLDGTYDVVILSAVQSNGLITWLTQEGYAVPAATSAALQDYIDAGSFFVAAKVTLNAATCGGIGCDTGAGVASSGELPPLQVSYTSPSWGLPIRLGTVNARGPQDLILYTITQAGLGAMGIANYPQAEVEDDCMFDQVATPLAEFYPAQFDAAITAAGGNAWVREYSWTTGFCDPCTAAAPYADDLIALGASYHAGSHFTRIHMRYDPTVTQDLVLYTTGLFTPEQERYIQYEERFEDLFPICNLGWAPNPGSCWEDSDVDDTDTDAALTPTDDTDTDAAVTDETDDSAIVPAPTDDTDPGETDTDPGVDDSDVQLDSDLPDDSDASLDSDPLEDSDDPVAPTDTDKAGPVDTDAGVIDAQGCDAQTGCSQSGGTPALWFVFALVPWLRRRR